MSRRVITILKGRVDLVGRLDEEGQRIEDEHDVWIEGHEVAEIVAEFSDRYIKVTIEEIPPTIFREDPPRRIGWKYKLLKKTVEQVPDSDNNGD